jgi:hypothetical protein
MVMRQYRLADTGRILFVALMLCTTWGHAASKPETRVGASDNSANSPTNPQSASAPLSSTSFVDESNSLKAEGAKAKSDGEFLKATDWFLVIFNGLLVLYTARLWYSTRDLVTGAEDTAKKQLRSYVALESIDHDPPVVTGVARGIKIRVKNYGQTPAHHVSIIHTAFEDAQPDTYRHPSSSEADNLGNQMLHPGQSLNYFAVASEGSKCVDRVIDVGLHQLRTFYVYGRIDYMDIYKRWWVTYFSERYDPSKPDGKRCTPHHHHNYEYPIA